MSEWKPEPLASEKEMEERRKETPIALYADYDVSERLLKKLRGYGFSIKVGAKRGYGVEIDLVHLQAATQDERCLLAQDKDYLTNRVEQLRKQIKYGLIIIEGNMGDEKALNKIARNCESMLNWKKEFFKRQAIFKIKEDSITAEYERKAGGTAKKQFEYREGRLWSRDLD